MEEHIHPEHHIEHEHHQKKNNQQQIAGAIIIAGVIIAGAILLKGNMTPVRTSGGVPITTLAPVGKNDIVLGNPKAKVTVVLYGDFQCSFCGAVSGQADDTAAIKYLKNLIPSWTPFVPGINEFVKNGNVQLVYRDFAVLGTESVRSAEAARCAGDQGKFWEYHDYLYGHQAGRDAGTFSDPNLKSFAQILGLNSLTFDNCLDTNKYAEAVAASKAEAISAGVEGTPKGFILKNGKIVGTIEGAESFSVVKPKIDSALK